MAKKPDKTQTPAETIQQANDRYMRAAHAMQTGVATEIGLGDSTPTDPKHLRVGINSAMSDQRALATLLIQKGIFTQEEYHSAVADAMELEKTEYEARLTDRLGKKVELM